MSEINQAQKEFWNGPGGDVWVSGQETLDSAMRPVTKILLEAAAVQAGDRVTDIGCGTGETSLEVAKSAESVLGVDVSGPMLAHAVSRAGAQGLSNVQFEQRDAQTGDLQADATLALSRFGVMFFEDPVAAFANIRNQMAADGRLCFACWKSPRENEWVSLPMSIVRKHIQDDTPPDPLAPGPFAFADDKRITSILEQSGWKDIAVTPTGFDMAWGESPEDAAIGLIDRGPLRRIFVGDPNISEETKQAIIKGIQEALPPAEGGIFLKGAIWIVTAKAN
jgi:ubiquinone/menaquinone biosynthesis C-methylase UbiE